MTEGQGAQFPRASLGSRWRHPVQAPTDPLKGKEMSPMKMEEIHQRYEGEWVLIEYTILDEYLHVVEGEVMAHSPNREAIYHQLLKTKGKDIAIEYFGKIPDDLAVMLPVHANVPR